MKLSIISGAYALVSDVKVEDMKLLGKYNPDALTIKDAEGNTTFAIAYSEGKPSIASFGITFSGEGIGSDEGKACITEILPKGLSLEKAKEYVAEKFGGVVGNLRILEEAIPIAAQSIRSNKQALIDSIVIPQ